MKLTGFRFLIGIFETLLESARACNRSRESSDGKQNRPVRLPF